MLSCFMFLFSTFCFLNHVKSYDLDFSDPKPNEVQVIVSEYKDPTKKDKTIAKFFNANTQDAFSSVKDGTYNVWDQRATHMCDFVKVFYEQGKAVALKLGIQKRDSGSYLRSIEGLFYLKDEKGLWKNVLKSEYLDFLKDKGFKNLAWVNYETDEKFQKHTKFKDVDIPIDTPQPKKVPDKSLRRDSDKPAGPIPGGPDETRPKTRPGPPPGDQRGEKGPSDKVPGPPPEGETPEEKRKRLAHKTIQENSNVIPENEKKKSSFLTSTLLIPATILLFYVSY